MGLKSFNSSYCNELEKGSFIYFNARYYDPEVGRFLTEDPSRKGTSWYTYCNNNPLTFTDPDGKKPVDEVGEGITYDERSDRFYERTGSRSSVSHETVDREVKKRWIERQADPIFAEQDFFYRYENKLRSGENLNEIFRKIKEVFGSEEVGFTVNVLSSILTIAGKVRAGTVLGAVGLGISVYKYIGKAEEGDFLNIELADIVVSASGIIAPMVPVGYEIGKLTYTKAIKPVLTEIAEFEVGVRRDPLKLFKWMDERFLLSRPRP